MNDNHVRQVVEAAIHHVAPEVDIAHVRPGTDLREDLEIDSMDFLNVVDELHEVLGIDIPEHDYPFLATIDGCVQYLVERLPDPGAVTT